MDSPGTPNRASASGRSSVIESIRGCTLAGVRIPKEELKKKIAFPEYIRLAMREAIRVKDVDADTVVQFHHLARALGTEPAESPEFPLVVFINCKSGGRHGPELKARLQDLMSEEQVFATCNHSYTHYTHSHTYLSREMYSFIAHSWFSTSLIWGDGGVFAFSLACQLS